MEKEICTAQSPAYFEKKGVFENRLVVFHKLEKFIHPDAYIEYETDVVRFSFSKPSEIFRFEWKDRWRYIRPKTIYIPSERNIVATIPNWFDVKLEENNIRSFMSDWEEARSYYAGTPIGILNLGVNYSFEKTNRHDTIRLKNQQTIDFTNASSGLQSIVPLLVILRYVTKGVYNEKKKDSVSLETIHNKLIREIYNEMKRRFNERGNSTRQLNENALSVAKGNQIYTFYDKKDVDYFNRLTSNFMFSQYSNIFLEEPELNLYPTTQRELMNCLAKLTNDERHHNVFITTHSPYLLTSLNNLLYAAKVGTAQKDAVMYTPKWSNHIFDEWKEVMRRKGVSLEESKKRVQKANIAFPDALVEHYENLIEHLCLPDEKDRHVLAAAIKTNAHVIVSNNLKHFPEKILKVMV